MRSRDMVARYVVPEISGYLVGLRKSQDFVATNRGVFDRAKEAIMSKINENEAAVAALAVTKSPRLSASASNVPDLDQARALMKARKRTSTAGSADQLTLTSFCRLLRPGGNCSPLARTRRPQLVNDTSPT